MIELYTLLLLSTLLLISLLANLALPSPLQGWLAVWQTSIVLVALLLIYLPGLWLVYRIYRPSRPEALQPGKAGSLAWRGHLILSLIMLVDLSILVGRPTANPFHLAMLAMGCVVSLSTFISSWREVRRPPISARALRLTPGPGFINITWTPPDDAHYAESLLVRSPATFMPAHPEQGKVLCRGVLSAWRDEEVEPGTPYAYAVFTYDGQGHYGSTAGQTCAAFPSPFPPTDLTYSAERSAIQLRWKLIDPYNLRAVRINRRVVGAERETDENWAEIEVCESWRDGKVSSGTHYEYWVHTVDAWGQQSEPARVLAVTLVEPLVAFEARVVGRNRVRLTWQLPAEVSDFQNVVVTRIQEEAGGEPEQIYIGTDGEHIDRGLAYDTAYHYAIQVRYANLIRSEPRTARVVTGPRPANVAEEKIV